MREKEGTMRSKVVALGVLATLAAGCSSSYVPAAGPRLSVVMEGGTPTYVRDGKKFEGGFLGGDIEEAVHGSPKAEEYAHEFKTGITTGFAMTMIGTVGIVGGAAITGVQASRADQNTVPIAGLLVMGGGLLLELIGLGVEFNALPHFYDAINAYNDDLTPAGGR
jgi:hypothetical protein